MYIEGRQSGWHMNLIYSGLDWKSASSNLYLVSVTLSNSLDFHYRESLSNKNTHLSSLSSSCWEEIVIIKAI